MLLQQIKLLGGIDKVHSCFTGLYSKNEPFALMTIENCFKVQCFFEMVF